MLETNININLRNHRGGYVVPKEHVHDIILNAIDYKDLIVDEGYDNTLYVKFFQMGFTEQTYDLGRKHRELYILNSSTPMGCEVTDEIYGTIMEFGKDCYPDNILEVFYDDKGKEIGAYFGHKGEDNTFTYSVLYIFPNLLIDTPTSDGINRLDILKNLMVEFNERVVSKWDKNLSWDEYNKDELRDMLRKFFTKKDKEELDRAKSNLDRVIDDISHFRSNLISSYQKQSRLMNDIERLESRDDSTIDKLFSELNLIKKHDKVEELKCVSNNIVVRTVPLDIYDSKDNRYYGGRYSIYVNLENYNIKFDSDNRRPGYWSDNDVHPHISGSGNACLGNVEPICIELINQNEYYALILSLIDFLQNANLSDVAGRKVKNWDKYDSNGNVTVTVYTEEDEECWDDDPDWTCDSCGDGIYDEDNRNEVYSEYGDEEMVCDYCLEHYYHWDEETEVYVRNEN